MAIASDMYQYLDHGGVEAIIKPLLRRLLVKMPEEPVAFIIKDLCSQYPNEAGKAVAALTKNRNETGKAVAAINKFGELSGAIFIDRDGNHNPGADLHEGRTLEATILASSAIEVVTGWRESSSSVPGED
eukprot:gene27360-36124_t